MGLETLGARVIEVIEFNPKLKAIRFVPDGGPTAIAGYLPGDFLYLRIPAKGNVLGRSSLLSLSGKDEVRAYSLSSSPTQPFYEITVVEKEDEPHVSKLLQYVKSGRDMLEISTPDWIRKGRISMGDSLLARRNVVMIGGGTGFAPFVGAVRFIADKNLANQAVIIGSFRSPDFLIFHEEILAIADTHPNVRYFPVLTREWPQEWPWGRGRLVKRDQDGMITDNGIAELLKNPQGFQAYVCGGTAMVADTKEALISIGINEACCIKTESW